jgi:hypothetical protein
LPRDRHGGFGERPGETDREQTDTAPQAKAVGAWALIVGYPLLPDGDRVGGSLEQDAVELSHRGELRLALGGTDFGVVTCGPGRRCSLWPMPIRPDLSPGASGRKHRRSNSLAAQAANRPSCEPLTWPTPQVLRLHPPRQPLNHR